MGEPLDKPGLRALEAMKNLNKTVSIFKIPKIPQKKSSKMKILTEERYIEELGKIIQKDFFPDLEKLKAQNQYLDAVEKNDVIKLRELYAKYSGPKPSHRSSNGYDSPATFETPMSKPDATPGSEMYTPQTKRSNQSPAESSVTKTVPSENHSLDSFLCTYTSEDNHSFQEIIELSDRKLRQKFAVLYDAETETAKQMTMAMVLPSIEKQFKAVEGSKPLDMWTYKNRNYVMYVPDGVELTKEEKLEMAKRKQEVVYSNTRLQHNPFDDKQSKETITELARCQAKILSGKIGVDGNKLESRDEPNVRGFSFVKTPSPCPGVTDSPLMTWGEIEGTPFRLDGSDTPVRPASGPSFRINETSRRENIALELAEKAGERMRGQKAKAMEAARRNIASPHIRSSIQRLASMSPAAKRLASARLGIHDSIITPSPRRSTPTPKSLRKATTPSPLLIRRKVPTATVNVNAYEANSDEQSKSLLTDDLLKIPAVRKKASDFF
ncbi:splicing factor ESS-2 homolog [Bradysia coprophila]|uniref:splicing factor ESS-2 homolog n=1 Tax=Bradysia coprophila TaxID=38358 RepID=UPI00187DD59A|nr:splicing factor ESS-2 homolog [Bradysia coprophila]